MRKILDKLFENKKLSMIIPIAIAVLIYLLFVIFGTAEDKRTLMIQTPILMVLVFFGLFLVIFVQIKNPMCPEWFVNLFEILAILIFGLLTIAETVSFLISGFENFSPVCCMGMLAYSAVAWVHSKRAGR